MREVVHRIEVDGRNDAEPVEQLVAEDDERASLGGSGSDTTNPPAVIALVPTTAAPTPASQQRQDRHLGYHDPAGQRSR
jgi:hypothetical protein